MERHPDDPDHLPATHAWRAIVTAVVNDPKSEWTRSSLASAAKTTSSQVLKLLNGTTKSSAVVRRINAVLNIPFVEPQPVSEAQARVIAMMMRVEDLGWLEKTIDMIVSDDK